jgi:hypothetical protein
LRSLKAEHARASAAELILGLVTTRAHAATIAGDLIEASESRRRAFLADLCVTTAALALYSIISTPRRSALFLALTAAAG